MPHRANAGRTRPATALLTASTPAAAQAALAAIEDPLARLVAAAVLLRTGRAGPEVVVRAVDTASAQGWRRPLLAWLDVQLRGAQGAGDAEAAERIRRRIRLVETGAALPA